ncbi:acyltransferase [Methanococcoides methylutens]|uniref:acyltransferase n=1 Tax=Methanococcoides methylutens TaxID=2226 RepID=UPI004043E3E2
MPINNVKLGNNVTIPYPDLVNLYGCEIRDNCFIGPFVEIQKDVIVGENTRIQSHTFVCSKVTIGKDAFIGHGVMFINDRHPVRTNSVEWEETIVEDRVVIGSNATILPCRIGKDSLVGAGAVVTKNVHPNEIVAGNPAKVTGKR